jgi:flagellin-like protein
MNKKGVSPVVATILLIVIVVIIALIIFLWARGFIKESIMKKGENVDFACDKVKLDASYFTDTGELQISNIGNIPLYSFSVKIQTAGKIEKKDFSQSIANGQAVTVDIGSGDSIRIIPVLLGQVKKDNSQVAYVCKTEITPDKETIGEAL